MGRRPVLERPRCIDYEYHNSTVFFFLSLSPNHPLPFFPPTTPSLYNAKVLIGPNGGLSAFDLITTTVTLH